MNITIACRCRGEKQVGYKDPLYKGVGNVIELSKHENKNIVAHFVRAGRVVWPVARGHPILVDSCKWSEYIVEMDLSSRYVIVDNACCNKHYYSTIKGLFERKIYTLTKVERPDFDAVKSKLVQSYYSSDGKLRDSTFKHNLSPIKMAEAGIGFSEKGMLMCYFHHNYYRGLNNHCMKVSDWRGCLSSPALMHQQLLKCPPCIELKKYHYPVLTSESGEDVTGETYRMILPDTLGGHPKIGCQSAVLVTDKNYELPVLTDQELQHEVELASIDQLKQQLKFKARRSKAGLIVFTNKVQQFMYRVHFKSLFAQFKLESERFINRLKKFQAQVADKDDKDEIQEKRNVITSALRRPGIEDEVNELVAAIADYEMICNFSKVIKRCAERETVEWSRMIDRTVVREELVRLDAAYSNRFFVNDFFNDSVSSADFDDLFCDFHHYFWSRSDDNKVIVDLNVARTDLLKSINAVHMKVKELLTIYLDACKGGDWVQVFDFS